MFVIDLCLSALSPTKMSLPDTFRARRRVCKVCIIGMVCCAQPPELLGQPPPFTERAHEVPGGEAASPSLAVRC